MFCFSWFLWCWWVLWLLFDARCFSILFGFWMLDLSLFRKLLLSPSCCLTWESFWGFELMLFVTFRTICCPLMLVWPLLSTRLCTVPLVLGLELVTWNLSSMLEVLPIDVIAPATFLLFIDLIYPCTAESMLCRADRGTWLEPWTQLSLITSWPLVLWLL